MSMGNGYIGHSMSVNAAFAYETGEKPMSKWTKEAMLDGIKKCFVPEDQHKANEFVNWSASELKTLLVSRSWHHTSGAYNKTDFYEISEERVNKAIENNYSRPIVEKKRKDDFEEGYVHGTYKVVEYHPYSSHSKYIEHHYSFVNGRIKGNWVYFTDGTKKARQNVTIEKHTKIKKSIKK